MCWFVGISLTFGKLRVGEKLIALEVILINTKLVREHEKSENFRGRM